LDSRFFRIVSNAIGCRMYLWYLGAISSVISCSNRYPCLEKKKKRNGSLNEKFNRFELVNENILNNCHWLRFPTIGIFCDHCRESRFVKSIFLLIFLQIKNKLSRFFFFLFDLKIWNWTCVDRSSCHRRRCRLLFVLINRWRSLMLIRIFQVNFFFIFFVSSSFEFVLRI